MNQYVTLLPAVFAAILVQYTNTESLIESLLESIFDSLLKSHVEKTSNQKQQGVQCEALAGWNTVSSWKIWLIEGTKSVEALMLTLT